MAAMADLAPLLLRNPSSPPLLVSQNIPFVKRSTVCSSGKLFSKFSGLSCLRWEGGLRLWRSKMAVGATAGGMRCVHQKVCCAQASVDEGGTDRKEPELLPLGELLYFGKLSLSCVVGAILIKYGSLLLPSITKPNLDQALLMIWSPVVASVVLLTMASIVGSDWIRRKQ